METLMDEKAAPVEQTRANAAAVRAGHEQEWENERAVNGAMVGDQDGGPFAAEPGDTEATEARLALLREPFPVEAIGALPRAVSKDDNKKFECRPEMGNRVSADGKYCGGYHVRSFHLDYVGHAAVTDRLLKVDPFWNWEPVAWDAQGLPLVTGGGLWIRLTICGVTRLGYGDAPGKRDVTKELIGDAIRNAGMRFGIALDLWSKENLHDVKTEQGRDEGTEQPPVAATAANRPAQARSDQRPPERAADAAPTVDWVAETAQAGSRVEALALYKRAKEAGELAAAITVDGKVQTVGEYITSWGITLKNAEQGRLAAQARQQRIASETDPGTGEVPYDDNEPI